MADSDLLAWAARWHYPQLRLSGKDVIQHGERHWTAFVASKDATRRILAEQRIQQWNALAKGEKR